VLKVSSNQGFTFKQRRTGGSRNSAKNLGKFSVGKNRKKRCGGVEKKKPLAGDLPNHTEKKKRGETRVRAHHKDRIAVQTRTGI